MAMQVFDARDVLDVTNVVAAGFVCDDLFVADLFKAYEAAQTAEGK